MVNSRCSLERESRNGVPDLVDGMTLTGFEPLGESSENTGGRASGDAESDAVLPTSSLQNALDALAQLSPADRAKLASMLLNGEGDHG